MLDNDRQQWQRIYVEGPATGTLGKSLFFSEYSKKSRIFIIFYSKRTFWSDDKYSWC